MGSTTTTTTTVAATMTAPAPPSAQATWGAVGSENMDDPALLGCISRTEVPSPDQAPRSSAAPPHEQALPTSSEVSDAGMVQSERTSTSSLCSKDGTLLLPDSSESPLLSSGSTSSISNLHHSNSSTHPGSEAGTNISSRSTGEIRNPSSSSLTPSQAADGRRTMDDYPSLSTPPGLDPPSISSYVHGPREDELPPGDHTEEQRGENVPSQLEGAEVGLAPPPPSAVLAPVECNKSREPGQPTPFRPLLPSAIVAEELSPSSSLPLSPVRLSPSLDTAHAIKQFKPSPRDVISGIAPHVFDERSTRGRRSHSRGRRSARRASLGGYHHQQPVTWQRASPLRRSIVITWDEKSIYLEEATYLGALTSRISKIDIATGQERSYTPLGDSRPPSDVAGPGKNVKNAAIGEALEKLIASSEPSVGERAGGKSLKKKWGKKIFKTLVTRMSSFSHLKTRQSLKQIKGTPSAPLDTFDGPSAIETAADAGGR